MTNIEVTTTAGEWLGRLDVVEALEADGWVGDDDAPLSILRKNGCVFAVTNECDDSGVTGPGGWTADFPSDVPSSGIIAFCRDVAHEAWKAANLCPACGHQMCLTHTPCGALLSVSVVSESRCPCTGATAGEA